MSLRLVAICGKRGAGKETVLQALLRNFPGFRRIVPHTTRLARPTEVNGREYHFVTDDEFGRLVDRERFIWWKSIGPAQRSGTIRDEFVISRRGSVVDVLPEGARTMREKVSAMGGSVLLIAVEAADDERRRRIQSRDRTLCPAEVEKLFLEDPVHAGNERFDDFDIRISNRGSDPHTACISAARSVERFLG
jgi:guanylate kinase